MPCSLQTYRSRIGTFNLRTLVKPYRAPSSLPSRRKSTCLAVLLITNYCLLLTIMPSLWPGSTAKPQQMNLYPTCRTYSMTMVGCPSPSVQNKQMDIETIIATHNPHILGLEEANFKHTHDLEDVQQHGYTLHLDSCVHNPNLGLARVAFYTHNSLKVKRRLDL
jgi:hypothetical protein